jgi:hypothetical protein
MINLLTSSLHPRSHDMHPHSFVRIIASSSSKCHLLQVSSLLVSLLSQGLIFFWFPPELILELVRGRRFYLAFSLDPIPGFMFSDTNSIFLKSIKGTYTKI